MRKINEILAVVILSLLAVLLAAVGLRVYDEHVTYKGTVIGIKEQKEILARNKEANDRVQEMQQEIQELVGDREKLGQFIEEIQAGITDPDEAVFAAAMYEEEVGGMSDRAFSTEQENLSGNHVVSENDALSGNGIVSGNSVISGNAMVSGNSVISGNAMVSGNSTLSGNDTISGNSLLSGNDTVSGNSTLSGNDTMSGNSTLSGNDTISGNSTLSGNDTLSGNATVSGNHMPKRSAWEETLFVNQEDRLFLAERQPDFADKKIACLGDSITAAANLEEQENYPDCSYPSILQELLGAEEVYNLGIGGSSIGRYWADAFVERYKEIPPDTDIILVMGGTNDGFCLSEREFGTLGERAPWTFCGDLDELLEGLQRDYRDAEIIFITPLPNILQDYLMRERNYLLPQERLVDVMLTLCAEHDIPVIDLYHANILDSHDADVVADFMPDGVHANEEGYRILAEHIAANLARRYDGD